MKYIKYLFCFILLSVLSINVVNAASVTITSNKKNVTVGSTFNVTVTVNRGEGNDAADAWQYTLVYDSSLFSTSSQTEVLGSVMGGNGTVTFTFKAKKSGTGTFSLKNVALRTFDDRNVPASTGSVTVTAKTQQEIEASYSTNADLRSLSVSDYEISPSFDKNTLEYSLEVENDVESVNVSAVKADGNASVSGAGEIVLSEGINKVEIVVTAQKGNKKTYVLNITRKELNPIIVEVDGEKLNVVRKAENLEVPMYYSSTTINIEDYDVPAFESEITGFTLVGLKDEDGNIELYRYENGNYVLYNQIAKDSFVFIPLESENLVTGYENKKNIKINDIEVLGYSDKEEDTEFVLIYGMNASNGDKNWYKYDTKEGTFQRYDAPKNGGLSKDEYFYLTIAFACGLGLSIIIIILLLIMVSIKDKKNKKLISMIEKKMGISSEKEKVEEKTVEEIEEKNEDEEEIEKLNDQFLHFFDKQDDESLDDEKSSEPVEETEGLSRRELRKLEKEKKKQEEAELLAMQQDFLETRENDILSDTDIIEEVIDNSKSEDEEEAKPEEKVSKTKKTSKSKKGKKKKK